MLLPWLFLSTVSLRLACICHKMPSRSISYWMRKTCFHASLSTHPLHTNFAIFQHGCEPESILKTQSLVFNVVSVNIQLCLWISNTKRLVFVANAWFFYSVSFQIKYRCWTVSEFETSASWWSCYEFSRSRNQVLINAYRFRFLDSIYHSLFCLYFVFC